MSIPSLLQEAIEKEAEKFNFLEISSAREELTARYRQTVRKDQAFMTTDAQRCAYVIARMPATYTVIRRVLAEIQRLAFDQEILTLLDLGAGPGSVMWAANEVFSNLDQITLIEKDNTLANLGKRLASHSDAPSIRKARWLIQDLEVDHLFSKHDLITLSYAIGELPPSTFEPLLESCWNMTEKCLVIIEPGTPAGFERIRQIRAFLLSLGAYPIAPCPHALRCPMPTNDWCHFSERVDRSSLHRRIKTGSLGYEDEKYSYIAVSKTPVILPSSRILRHPQKRSGHLLLPLCKSEGLVQEIVSKRNPDLYKEARKAEWGDAFPEPIKISCKSS